jgi:exoribonuclease II
MSQQAPRDITTGTVLEFFESKEIVCGVCLAVKNLRFTVLTENNREINLAQSRVIHIGDQPLNLKIGRDELVQRLASISARRRQLMEEINVEELWSLLQDEQDGFDAREMTGFVFNEPVTDDQISATQRVLFQDNLYFQLKDDKFLPYSQEKIEQKRLEKEREEEKEAQLEQGSKWLQAVWNRKSRPPLADLQDALVESLKSYCLFGQESRDAAFVKELFRRANIPPQPQSAFRLLVRLGVWSENENLYLHEHSISSEFPEKVLKVAEHLISSNVIEQWDKNSRKDLRSLHTFTVDSALTRDYDDALSLRVLDDGLFEVGIHIADAAEFIQRGDPLDEEAQMRASSIYLPDGRIAMLPPSLSEGICSLRAGEDRLALSFLLRMDAEGVIHAKDIVLSVVNIKEQITYEEVNARADSDESLRILCMLSRKLREKRLANGAVILPIPEIHVFVNAVGMIQLSRYEKESPSQILVSEWMIAANGIAASFLAEREIPAIFRAQAECKQETDFTQSEHEIFRIYRQRRLFARAEINVTPKMHCSLAMPHYTTVTSPIRRYSDLVVQRQLKHAILTNSSLYSGDELRQLITLLGAVQSKISFIQRKWTRYWILKFMEQEDLQTLNALILEQNDRFAHLLLPDFLIETNVPLTEKTRPQPGEMVRIKIDKLNPREDILRVQLPEF